MNQDELDILTIDEEGFDFDQLLVHLKFKKLQAKDQKEDSQSVGPAKPEEQVSYSRRRVISQSLSNRPFFPWLFAICFMTLN